MSCGGGVIRGMSCGGGVIRENSLWWRCYIRGHVLWWRCYKGACPVVEVL